MKEARGLFSRTRQAPIYIYIYIYNMLAFKSLTLFFMSSTAGVILE